MFAIRGPASRLCQGPTRRDFLRVGALGGLFMPALLRAANQRPATPGFGRAKRAILLYLTGGPPQLDTWDPKPDGPAAIRGETRAIPTTVPGIHFGDLFPRLAQRARQLCIVRSVTHADNVHPSAGYTML